MVKKKIISMMAVVLIATSTISLPGFSNVKASEKDDLSTVQKFNKKHVQSKAKIYKLTNLGLSSKDANYYAKLDDMFKFMEDNSIKINFDDSEQVITDGQVTKDVDAFREKVLSGDKAALKKAIYSSLSTEKNLKEAEKMLTKFGGTLSEYKYICSDGSELTFNSTKNLSDKKTALNIKPVGYSETYFGRGTVTTGYNSGTIGWTMTSGSSYAKIEIYDEGYVNTSSRSASMSYARGGQASAGYITIANTNGGVISRATNNNTTGKPAEANNQVVWSVSGSVGGSFYGVSFAVTRGRSWTQYVYDRQYGDGVYGCYAGLYQ